MIFSLNASSHEDAAKKRRERILMTYVPDANRYAKMSYRRSGASGLKLPAVSLGLWHNFGSIDVYENARAMARTAFDVGITHFDLANNYGPEPGSAEITFGRILQQDLRHHRDELVISSKAGYLMWPGPYGEWGSRKNLIASCDQSLKRLGLDYVDIFYHHRPDPETPLEESMLALDQIVRSGKALYAGISNYNAERTRQAAAIMRELKTPFIIHQVRYNILNRQTDADGLLQAIPEEKLGAIVFSPLAQGLLSDKYLSGVIPPDSRAARKHFLKPETLTATLLSTLQKLNNLAAQRGQTLAQMALAWLLAQDWVTSVLIGASRPAQITDAVKALDNIAFSQEELARIDALLP